MARQTSVTKIQGTIDDLTYYRDADGVHRVKRKSEISKEKILTDPAFARTRENMSEFGNAGKAGRLIREAFKKLLRLGKDRKVVSRLFQRLMKVLHSDTTSPRGERKVSLGDLQLLKNFQFNINAPLSPTFATAFTVTYNRTLGTATLSVPAYIPEEMVSVPEGATHFKMVSAVAEVDFESDVQLSDVQVSAYQAWDNNTINATTVDHQVTINTTKPLFLVVGIQFFQHTNGQYYTMNNGAFNSLAMISIDNS